jgi:hypothetical protein
MESSNQADVVSFWAREMAVAPEVLLEGPPLTISVQSLYNGVQLFLRDARLIVAVPEKLHEFVPRHLVRHAPETIFSVAFLEDLFRDRFEKILGPAHVAYADGSNFRGIFREGSRPLTEHDTPALELLAAGLTSGEMAQSGFDPKQFPACGVFSESVLVAAANYKIWESRLAHITVAVSAAHRGRGYAQAAVTGLSTAALAAGLVLQYRSLATNSPSLGVARALGFQKFATTLYLRLK